MTRGAGVTRAGAGFAAGGSARGGRAKATPVVAACVSRVTGGVGGVAVIRGPA
ncbi:MAG: hypothetical protein HY597_01920 [Candidatus Omnitrophica bacterium]|nr:hypothetical protein [Candidatus Omnitrophota bacterium]